MQINVGCGELRLDGYLNIDRYDDRADLVADPMTLEYEDVDEVRMDHVLEHVAIRETGPLLHHLAGWLRSGGQMVVEVPDMEEMMAHPGPNWLTDIYGVQIHEGEFHRSGWTAESLVDALYLTGVKPEKVSRFRSTHPYRRDFPCLLVVALK